MIVIKQSALETLTQSLADIFTPTQITQSILSQLSLTTVALTVPLPISASQAMLVQDTIGWHQCLLGCININWRMAYTALHDPRKQPKPSVWASKLILGLWTYMHTLWKGRNQVVHGITLAESMKCQISQYQEAITTMYMEYASDPFLFPTHLRCLFDRPLSKAF
jgi:hypothetical protein